MVDSLITKLTSKIELLEEQKDKLQDKITDLTITKRDLELKIDELQKENEQLKGNLKFGEILYSNLKKELSEKNV